ncbi:hypothetical protein HY29_17925 [Hyphomonas beringensis]|uniref:Uncharacterized protein n=2 Tax=Hyphomonas beringensis TaxID=1280946 RepID=A0A062U9K0_9PROT|nr:hypothetical protein HY29_17925 [Hyphomonas beringensis]
MALLLSSVFVLSNMESHLESVLMKNQAREASLRQDLLERRSAERETGTLGELAQRTPEKLTAGARLSQLSNYAAATPPTAIWTSMKLDGRQARISGVGPEAASILSALAERFPDSQIRFAESVSDMSDGRQSFVIEISGPDE